jgi:AcrR family transcriptional regulator
VARSAKLRRKVSFDPLQREQWIKRQPVTDLGRRIVSAAVEEFAAKGVLGARVAEITRRAGTTDPAFYRYFTGLKEAALFVLGEYYWAPLNVRLSHYRQITQAPLQLFDAIVDALVQSTADDPSRPWLAESQVFRIVVTEMRSPFLLPESLLDSEYQTFIKSLEEILRRGQQEGVFIRGLNAGLLAQLLVNTLHGLLMLNGIPFQPVNVGTEEVKKVAELLVGREVLAKGPGLKKRRGPVLQAIRG